MVFAMYLPVGLNVSIITYAYNHLFFLQLISGCKGENQTWCNIVASIFRCFSLGAWEIVEQ